MDMDFIALEQSREVDFKLHIAKCEYWNNLGNIERANKHMDAALLSKIRSCQYSKYADAQRKIEGDSNGSR